MVTWKHIGILGDDIVLGVIQDPLQLEGLGVPVVVVVVVVISLKRSQNGEITTAFRVRNVNCDARFRSVFGRRGFG
jgi:hypothetical protein